MQSDKSVKGLTTKKFIDQKTGELYYKYFWKRNEVPTVEIKGKLPDKLSGYTLIRKDLDNALGWVDLAEELMPPMDSEKNYAKSGDRKVFNQVKGLFVAALTFYGKCFTEAEGRNAQISRNWLDAEHKELHDYYMKLRHNFAAHSGKEKFELAKSYVLLHPKKKMNFFLIYLPHALNQILLYLVTEKKVFESYLFTLVI